jgi:general secretion pathway protein D
MRLRHAVLLGFACVVLVACGTKAIKPSDKHIQQTPDTAKQFSGAIPQTSKNAVILPPPAPAKKVETYSVIFSDGVTIKDALFALARDSKINIDIKDGDTPKLQQKITLNAINQTLPQILERIAKQSDIRYEFDGHGNLMVMPDDPFMKTYKIDFINMSRTVKSSVFTSSQIGGTSTGATGNTASTSVTSETKNNLMDSVVDNVKAILQDEDRFENKERIEKAASAQAAANRRDELAVSGNGNQANGKFTSDQKIDSQTASVTQISAYVPAVNINANKETGVLIVRATGRQHKKIQEFIDRVMTTARRQVMIEATIAEVSLNSNYQQGVDWSSLRTGAKGFNISQAGSAGLASANTGKMFLLDYANPTSKLGNLAASVQLLDSFGDVKVLSSPKLSVMNNQTATLKVVDNRVYFTITVTPGSTTGTTITSATYTTTPVPVSVGFTMNVTPEINDSDYVTINVRPTITRIIGYVSDPNPSLGTVVNRVPEIRTREMESIIRVSSGQIAVLGGLMQDELNNLNDGIPLLDDLPGAGNFFKNRNETKTKTELVIFLRPIVIKDASLNGDYSDYRNNLPNSDFLKSEDEKANR